MMVDNTTDSKQSLKTGHKLLIVGIILFIGLLVAVWAVIMRSNTDNEANINPTKASDESYLKENTEIEEGTDTAPTDLMQNSENRQERTHDDTQLQTGGSTVTR